MPKQLYVDVDELDNAITKSGVKIGFICDKLGLSRQGFEKKRKGLTPFKASEVYVLCDLLRIYQDEVKHKIFYPKG